MRTSTRIVAFATLLPALVVLAALPSGPASAGYSCMGRAATIVGTPGTDLIHGVDSAGADVIVTLGGDDTVYAGGGRDLVCAGTGDDTVNGMTGSDVIQAGPGDDAVGGGYDSDIVYLGGGADSYYGDAGGSVNHLDTIYGQAGRDRIDTDLDSPMNAYGGRGPDWIRAFSRWSDHVYGGPGADVINVRDFDYYEGTYVQSDDADTVEAGSERAGTRDSCVVNINDTVLQCEAVERHAD
jgi:Ca2+-binding RTX toxin-like protein